MTIPAFTLARALRASDPVFVAWCSLPYPIVAETLAREGFPAVTIESQHGLWDMSALLTAVAAVRQGGAAAVVRVPIGDSVMVGRALDFGAEAIIAPMINSAADARAFAAAAKYPPLGERSWGPHRALSLAGITDQSVYLREANDHIVTLAMIETKAALDNLDAIIDTPGIDGLFLGPSDLSIALSNGKKLDPTAPDVEAALDRIVAAAERTKKIPGVFCHTPERAAALAKRGMRFLAVTSDLMMLRAGAAAAMKVFKG
jgi:4-hydroxy-2-oxoheptanedioate aldolase